MLSLLLWAKRFLPHGPRMRRYLNCYRFFILERSKDRAMVNLLWKLELFRDMQHRFAMRDSNLHVLRSFWIVSLRWFWRIHVVQIGFYTVFLFVRNVSLVEFARSLARWSREQASVVAVSSDACRSDASRNDGESWWNSFGHKSRCSPLVTLRVRVHVARWTWSLSLTIVLTKEKTKMRIIPVLLFRIKLTPVSGD